MNTSEKMQRLISLGYSKEKTFLALLIEQIWDGNEVHKIFSTLELSPEQIREILFMPDEDWIEISEQYEQDPNKPAN